jgi:small GTP-binding protein
VLKRKICLIGDFSVGKTSLSQKFVSNVFSDMYQATIGVRIDRVMVGDTKLIAWEVGGCDALSPINLNYLVGAAGIVLVCDGTRASTFEVLALQWQAVVDRIGEVPMVVAVNKSDDDQWQVSERQINEFKQRGWQFFNTSAKTGQNVQRVFNELLSKFD